MVWSLFEKSSAKAFISRTYMNCAGSFEARYAVIESTDMTGSHGQTAGYLDHLSRNVACVFGYQKRNNTGDLLGHTVTLHSDKGEHCLSLLVCELIGNGSLDKSGGYGIYIDMS